MKSRMRIGRRSFIRYLGVAGAMSILLLISPRQWSRLAHKADSGDHWLCDRRRHRCLYTVGLPGDGGTSAGNHRGEQHARLCCSRCYGSLS